MGGLAGDGKTGFVEDSVIGDESSRGQVSDTSNKYKPITIEVE